LDIFLIVIAVISIAIGLMYLFADMAIEAEYKKKMEQLERWAEMEKWFIIKHFEIKETLENIGPHQEGLE